MTDSSPNSKIMRSKSPPLTLDKDYLKNITTLNDKVIEGAIKEEDFSSSVALLTQFNQLLSQSGHYGTYSSNKKHYFYHLFVCYHNFAMVYQQKNDNIKAKENMQKAISNYERLQGYITNRQENVVFMTELVKLQLQQCGLLSHCDSHQQSVSMAQKSLDRIAQSARILQAICYEQALLNGQRETTCSSREKGCRNQLVDFKSVVIEEAEAVLQQLSQLPSSHRLMNEDKLHFQKIISKICSWKQNQSNNELALKRQLKVAPEKSTRNILGLQKLMIQQQFQIGSLMMLTFKTIAYSPHPDPLRLLSAYALRQMSFCASVGYFTIATQSRFGQSDLSQIRGNMKIDEKFKKLNHDDRLLKCKILHLKALEIAGRLLPPNNAIFGHLAQSFSRNYKFVMDQIHQVSEMNSTHTIKTEQRIQLKTEKQQMSAMAEYGMRVTPRLTKKTQRTKLQKSNCRKFERKQSTSKSQSKNRSKSNLKK